jgi:hypothetical protein
MIAAFTRLEEHPILPGASTLFWTIFRRNEGRQQYPIGNTFARAVCSLRCDSLDRNQTRPNTAARFIHSTHLHAVPHAHPHTMTLRTLLHYLRLPLHTATLLLIACFTLLLWIAENASLFGLPLLLVVVSWFFKYSFVLLDEIVDGRTEPPALSMEMVNPMEQRPFGMLLLLLVGYQLTGYLQPLIGVTGMHALRFAGVLIIPAMVAVMGITGRFFSGLHPAAVTQLIARFPIAYGQLVGTIALLWLIPAGLIYWFDATNFVTGLLGQALFMYLWLVMMAMIGGILYEQRDELGLEPAITPERAQARQQADIDREHDRFMDGIFAQCRSGTFDKAMVTISTFLDNSPDPLHEFRWLYAHAAKWPDQRLAARIMQLCLPRLLEARAHSEVLDRMRERLRASPTFRPDTAAQLIRVVTIARDGGDRITARHLLRDFAQYYPNDPATPIVEKLTAELAG